MRRSTGSAGKAGQRRKGSSASLAEIRGDLTARLRARASEVEREILRQAIAMHEVGGFPASVKTLRSAVIEGVAHVLREMEMEGFDSPSPAALVAHARHAARDGISLDLLLRGYAACDRTLSGCMLEESEGLPRWAVRRLMAEHGRRVDQLLASVADEFERETNRVGSTPSERLGCRVESLLVGAHPWEVGDLDYDFSGWHLALIVRGSDASLAAGYLASAVGADALLVPRAHRTVWLWLGSSSPVEIADVERVLPSCAPDACVAMGEPRSRFDGWRLSHREALAAYQVMLQRPRRLIRGSDVLLLAAVLKDRSWTRSLLETYMVPLDTRGESGEALRETLRAYFDTDQNAVTAAAVLGIDRHTVQRRLQKIERRIGRLLTSCSAELRVALDLKEIADSREAEGSFLADLPLRIA